MFDFIKNRDNKKIFVLIDHPKGRGPFASVLIIHGFKGFSSQRHLQGVSDSLVKQGFLTLRPDLTCDPGRSYLDFADMTYAQELCDVEDVLNFLLKINEVDAKRVGLAGHSLAGMIAGEVASKRGEIKALSILSGVYSFEFIAEHIFRKPHEKAKKEFNQKGWTSVWSKELETRLKIKRQFYVDVVERTADDFAKNIKCPTLVISSGRDESVVQLHADSWMRNLGAIDKKMEIIDGSDHNYGGENLDKVAKLVVDWFASKLKN